MALSAWQSLFLYLKIKCYNYFKEISDGQKKQDFLLKRFMNNWVTKIALKW